jgi:hypothetical protein
MIAALKARRDARMARRLQVFGELSAREQSIAQAAYRVGYQNGYDKGYYLLKRAV